MRAQTGHISETLHRFSRPQVSAINQAYQDALEMLGPDAARYDRRAALASLIFNLATAGELDESRLCSEAVAALQRSLILLRASR